MATDKAQPGASRENGDFYVALDLEGVLDGIGAGEDISITITPVPNAVVLSAGRDDGDKTWSLSPGHLGGLFLRDHRPKKAPFTLTVRVMRMDASEGTAEVAHASEIDIVPTEQGTPIRPAGAAPKAVSAVAKGPSRDEIEAELRAAYESEFSEASTELADEHDSKLNALSARLTEEADKRLREAQAAWREAEKARRAASRQTLTAKYEQQISAETAKLKAAFEDRLAEARKNWQRREADRLAEAQTTWDKEAEAQKRKLEAKNKDVRFRKAAEIEADRRNEAEILRAEATSRLDVAKAEWQAAEAGRIKRLKADLHAEAARALAEAHNKARDERAHELKGSEVLWRREEAGRLAAAHQEWLAGAEAAKTAQDKASDRSQADQRAALQAATEKALSLAKSQWKIEAERLAAKAQAAGKRETERRLAKAETAWKTTEAGRLNEATAKLREAAEAEKIAARAAAEADLSHRLEAERGRAEAELTARLAAAETRWRESEEDRHAALQAELSAASDKAIAGAQEELEAKFARELSRHEAEWREEEAERLLTTETRWRVAVEVAQDAASHGQRPLGSGGLGPSAAEDNPMVVRIGDYFGKTRRPPRTTTSVVSVIEVKQRA